MKTQQRTQKECDIRKEAISILTAVKQLDSRYGMNYLSQFLKGLKNLRVKEESHADLSCFGALSHSYLERIRMLIRYLLQEGLLVIRDARYGKIEITEKGDSFLQKPSAFIVAERYLRRNPYDKLLELELKYVRRQIRETEKTPAYRIFNDYTLSQIIQEKPQDVQGLKALPGLGDYKVDRYGHLILAAINRVEIKRKEDMMHNLLKSTQNPSSQEVKALFEAGLSVEEIAEKRNVKKRTVNTTLVKLHRAGHIDLRPWIEKHIDPETLMKGTHYFKNTLEKRLKIAYEQLGLDYETLRLCRLYVAKVSSVREEINM